MSASALVGLLQETHHSWLRRELPRILREAERAANTLGGKQRGLHELVLCTRSFYEEILIHMEKEEQILFKLVPRLEAGGPVRAFRRGSVASPIRVLLSDHLIANRALAQIREISNGLAARLGAPPEVHDLCRSLRELDSNMYRHIHLEDKILFPKIRQSEVSLLPKG